MKLRHREDRLFPQGHTAGKRQSWDWNLASLASGFVLLGKKGRGQVRKEVTGTLKSLDFILKLTKSHVKVIREAEKRSGHSVNKAGLQPPG